MTADLVSDTDGRLARPEVQRLLAKMRSRGVPSFERLGVDAARDMVEQAVALEAAPATVRDVLATSARGPAGDVPVRLYLPDTERPHGLTVFVHGGGWVTGSLDTADTPCRNLAAAAQHVVASIGYRRSPEARFPGPLEDVVAAVRHLAGRRPELGVPVDRLALVGDSAGANLVAAAVAELRGLVTDQVLLYPALSARCDTASHRANADDPMLSHDGMRWFWQQYLGDADPDDARAAPLHAPDLTGAPRTYLLTCGLDVLHDEGVAYAERLRAAGVEVTAIDLTGMTHGFLTMSRVLPIALDVVQDVARWLRSSLGARAPGR